VAKLIAIDLPDGVAARLERESDPSAFIAEAIRRRMAAETTRRTLAQLGFDVSDEAMAAAAARIDEANAQITPQVAAEMAARLAEAGIVLDTSALLAYLDGADLVAGVLATVAGMGLRAVVPATCLAEAYRHTEPIALGRLDILATLSHVSVAPLDPRVCAAVGLWARLIGPDLAHTVVEAATFPLVPLLTARRDLITRVLPPTWPIIDL
jgi:hypothetical protein